MIEGPTFLPILSLDSSNVAKIWRSWKKEFTLYIDLTYLKREWQRAVEHADE